jgi:hypothetical protein
MKSKMSSPSESSCGFPARNTVLNIAGQVVPLLAAVDAAKNIPGVL